MKLLYSWTRSCSICLEVKRWLVAGLLAAFIVAPSYAQDDAPAFLSVGIIQVEGGQGPNFEAAVKELQAARIAAGMPAMQVFMITIGHPNEYHLVTPVASIAEAESMPPPMPPAEAAVFFSRVTPLVQSARFFYARIYPENAIEAPAGSPQADALLLRTVEVAFGRETDFERWVAEDYVPALRQTDPLGHTFSRGFVGDSPLRFYHAYPLAGLESLDAPDPLQEVLSEREYEELFEPLEGIIVSHELVVGTIRTDLMGQ